MEWYRAASKQEHAEAYFRLGQFYATGRGVAQSEADAITYYRKSAALGSEHALSIIAEHKRKHGGAHSRKDVPQSPDTLASEATVTFGEALRDHPNADAILKLCKAVPTDEIPQQQIVRDPYDRKFKRPVDLLAYLQQSEKGLHLGMWWNHYE